MYTHARARQSDVEARDRQNQTSWALAHHVRPFGSGGRAASSEGKCTTGVCRGERSATELLCVLDQRLEFRAPHCYRRLVKILVTGGAGFIGSHIVDALLERGDQVLVFDDLSSGRRENVNARAEFVCGDLRDADGVRSVVERLAPDAICHQGAQTSVSRSVRDPILDAQINVLGTLNLLEATASTTGNGGLARFVLASTGGAIYGEVPNGRRARVGDPLLPISPYACSKLSAEAYVGAASRSRGHKATVLRYANVYGPRQDPHGEAGVVAIFSERLLRHEPIRINAMRTVGDTGCIRVHVRDVVRANLLALDGKLEAPIVNVCTGIEASTRELAEKLAVLARSPSELLAGSVREGDLARSVLEPHEDSRVHATVTLDEGLADTIAFFRHRIAAQNSSQ